MDIGGSQKKAETIKRSVFDVEAKFGAPSKRWKGTDDGKERPVAIASEENRDAHISKLPDELYIKIMEMVPIAQWASLERVNRRFQTVMHGIWARVREIRLNEFVYKKETLKDNPWRVFNLILEKLFRRAPNITSISEFFDFRVAHKSFCTALIPALAKFQHLQKISFSGGRLSAENFAMFLETSASRHCFNYLNIADSIHFFHPKSARLVAALGCSENLPAMHLEKFVLDTCHLIAFGFRHRFDWSTLKKFAIVRSCAVGVTVLCEIIERCVQLEHLELRIPPCGNHQPPHSQILDVVAKLENLSILKIMTADIYMPCSTFQLDLAALIQNLGRRRRRITGFALDYKCDDQIVSAICGHLPDLKSLELNVCKCKESSLKLLLTELKELEILELRSLTVAKTDGGVMDVMAASFGNLKRLLIHYSYSWSQNSNGLSHVQNIEGLKELLIHGRKIHGTTVKKWSHHKFGSFLDTLVVGFRDDVSSDLVGDWFRNLPRLRVLRSNGLTDDALKAIAESCPRLSSLELQLSPDITRSGIQSVIDCCSKLKLLKVVGHNEWFPKEMKVGKYRKIVFSCSR